MNAIITECLMQVQSVIRVSLDSYINLHEQKRCFQNRCNAVQMNGKQCSNKTKNSKLCKKHEKCKNVTLVKERKNFSCVLYHNHLPTNQVISTCPKCIINKTNCK